VNTVGRHEIPRQHLSQQAADELEELAVKHDSYEEFEREVLRNAERAWHNMRRKRSDGQGNATVTSINVRKVQPTQAGTPDDVA
jgi:hypothetical protein